jgi:hypothetical protein
VGITRVDPVLKEVWTDDDGYVTRASKLCDALFGDKLSLEYVVAASSSFPRSPTATVAVLPPDTTAHTSNCSAQQRETAKRAGKQRRSP